MTAVHQQDLIESNQTNQVAMETLKNELTKKGEEERQRLKTLHQSQIGW